MEIKREIEQHELFSIMMKKVKKEGMSVSSNSLKRTVLNSTSVFKDLLTKSSKNFEDYTLHDEYHALAVMTLMLKIIPKEVMKQLTSIECALLILSAYAHDIGMGAGRDRRDEIKRSASYMDFLVKNEMSWKESEQALENGDHKKSEFIQGQLFQNHLRNIHHKESASLVREEYPDLLSIEGHSLAEDVALLCQSHGESLEWIERNMRESLFCRDYKSDLAYLACILRLADYLELDPARAPESLLKLINPSTEIGMREWRKNQAACFFVSDDSIECQAMFDDFHFEKALRDTIHGIEKERRSCLEYLNARKSRDPNAYSLNLNSRVDSSRIRSVGYIYEEFRFQLEYKEIISLLMGTKLYEDKRVFLRELIQNSLDACRSTDAAVKSKNSGYGYQGKVTIRHYTTEEEGDKEIIEVSDNGSGMTRSIIKDYFMRIGCSYYDSYAFKRKSLQVYPVSQFGIGILSCFMVADKIEVETVPNSAIHPDEQDGFSLSVSGPDEFFVVKKYKRDVAGTTVRVFLSEPLQGDLKDLISRYVTRSLLEITLISKSKEETQFQSIPFKFNEKDLSSSFIDHPEEFGYKHRDIVFDSPLGFGIHGRLRLYILNKDDEGFLMIDNLDKYSFVGFTSYGQTLLHPEVISEEMKNSFLELHDKVNAITQYFPQDVQDEMASVLRRSKGIIDQLSYVDREINVLSDWHLLESQINSLEAMPSFASDPDAEEVLAYIEEILGKLNSFVSGTIQCQFPQSYLTQDGIDISSFYNFANHLKLGVGFVFNLDLCGEHRLSLNAARDRVLNDENKNKLVNYLYERIGKELGLWFREENIPQDQINSYLRKIPESLAKSLELSYNLRR